MSGFSDFPVFDPSQDQMTREEARKQRLYRAYKAATNPDTLSFPDTPEEKTSRQLQQIYDATPEFDVGFFGKFGNALAEETVTGQALSDLFDPTFPRTGYAITDEDVEAYAGDLPDHVIERLRSESFSFEQFLYEAQQARITLRRRKEIFSGGASGVAKGFGAVLLAAGGEAAVYTGIAMAATGSLAGPAAAASTASKITRLQGVARGLGYAGLVDLPLETARYTLDKTLTTTDLVINLGAAFTLGGGIGGLAPGMFSRVKGAAETAAARQGIEAVGDAGARKTAGKAGDALDPKISVRELDADDPTADVLSMTQRELEAEARRVGVALDSDPVTGPRVGVDGPDSDLYRAYEGGELPPGALGPDFPDDAIPSTRGFGVLRDPEPINPKDPLVRDADFSKAYEGAELPPGSPGPALAGPEAVTTSQIDLAIDLVRKSGRVTQAEMRKRFGKKRGDELLAELERRNIISAKNSRGRRVVVEESDREILQKLHNLPKGEMPDVGVPSFIKAYVISKNNASIKFLRAEFGLTQKQAEVVLRSLEAEGIVSAKKGRGARRVLTEEERLQVKNSDEADAIEAEVAGTHLEGKSVAEVKREKQIGRLLSPTDRELVRRIDRDLSQVVEEAEQELAVLEKRFLELADQNDKKLDELGRDEWLKWIETREGKLINDEAEKIADQIDAITQPGVRPDGQPEKSIIDQAIADLASFRKNPEKWLDNQKELDRIFKEIRKIDPSRRTGPRKAGERRVSSDDYKTAPKDTPERTPASLKKPVEEMSESEKQALREWQDEMKKIDAEIEAKIRADEEELAEMRKARAMRRSAEQQGKPVSEQQLKDMVASYERASRELLRRTVTEEADPVKKAKALKVYRLWRLSNNPMATGRTPATADFDPVSRFLGLGDIDVGLKQTSKAVDPDYLRRTRPLTQGEKDLARRAAEQGQTKMFPELKKRYEAAIRAQKRREGLERMRVKSKEIQNRLADIRQKRQESKLPTFFQKLQRRANRGELRRKSEAVLERRQKMAETAEPPKARRQRELAEAQAERNRALGEKQANVVNKLLRDKAIKKKSRERLQQEVIEARKKISARNKAKQKEAIEKGIKDQIIRDFANAPNDAARRLIAQSFGVTDSKLLANGSNSALQAATIVKAIKAYRKSGKVTRGTVGKPKIKGHKYKKKAKVGDRTVKLKGNIERMLWSLKHSRNKEAKEEIRQFLKSKGIDDPDKLADEFKDGIVRKIKQDEDALKDIPGERTPEELGEIMADLDTMGLKSAKRTREDGTEVVAKQGENFMGEARDVDIRIDRDLVEEADELFPNTNIKRSSTDNPNEIDDLTEPPMSAETDAVVVSDTGEALAEGPSRFVKLDVDAVAEDVGTRTTFGHGEGKREGFARMFEELGLSPNAANTKDKLALLARIGQAFYKVFTPTVFRLARSKSPFVRKLGRGLLTNPRARGVLSATAVAQANYEIAQTALKNGLRKAEQYAIKNFGRKLDEDKVIALVRGATAAEKDLPEQMAREAVDDYFKQIFKHAEGAGIFVDGVKAIKNYFPRIWAPSKFRRVIEDLGQGDWEKGQEKLTEFLTDAVLSHEKTRKVKMSRANAKRVAKRIVSYGINPDAHRDWNSTLSSLKRLKDSLVEELEAVQATSGKADFDADDLMELIIPMTEHQAHISFGRQRLGINELFSQEIEGFGTLKFSDLTDNNLDQITRHYGRQVLGAAEGRRLIEAVTGDANSVDGLPALVARVKEEAMKAGDDINEAEFFAKQIEFHFRLLTGQRVYSREIVKYGTMLNMLSMGTMGMALGIAQIPEIANIFLRTSFSAATNQIDLRDALDILKMGLKGKTTEANRFSSALETFTGVGGDINRRDHFMRRMDDLAIDDDFNRGFIGRALDNGRLFASLNPLGIMPMDTFLRRWAVRASFQHFVDTAYRAGPDGKIVLNSSWWNNSKVRFGELGMEADDIERLSRVLRNPEYVEVSQGIFGGYKVHNFDFSKVDDHYIVDKFILALRRHTDNMIQRQTPGELPAWMNAGVAKILTQFRVFTIAAKSKQLAAGIARGDAKEFANVIGSAALGMLGYSMITYYRSLGQEDPLSYWNEKTTTDRLIKSGIMRTGYSTIFPMLTDLLEFHRDGEGFFDASMRTTGLGIDPLKGSTAYKNVETMKGVTSTILQKLSGVTDFTRRDIRDIASLIWLTKIPIANQMFERYVSDNFPESNR